MDDKARKTIIILAVILAFLAVITVVAYIVFIPKDGEQATKPTVENEAKQDTEQLSVEVEPVYVAPVLSFSSDRIEVTLGEFATVFLGVEPNSEVASDVRIDDTNGTGCFNPTTDCAGIFNYSETTGGYNIEVCGHSVGENTITATLGDVTATLTVVVQAPESGSQATQGITDGQSGMADSGWVFEPLPVATDTAICGTGGQNPGASFG